MMRLSVSIALILLCGLACARSEPEEPVYHAASTMVTVPTLVRGPSGEFVQNLEPGDLTLYDNGVRQPVKIAQSEHEPIALVVMMQTGGIAYRHFAETVDLHSYLEWLTAGTDHELMLLTFDSRVEMAWHFPVRSDGVAHALTHLQAGDHGAAVIDAVQAGVQQLQSEPGHFRRIILLISQENDEGSAITAEELMRTVGKGSTAIYSLTFEGANGRGRTRNRVKRGAGEPLPLEVELRKRTAAKLSEYSGGAHLSFSTWRGFDDGVRAIAADIRNRYALTFQPSVHEPGLHRLTIEARKGLTVAARGGYWFESISSAASISRPR